MKNPNKKAACAAMLCMAMAAPLLSIAENETRVITCGTLNLRAEANTTSAVLGKYGWGTEVQVKGVNGDWASVDVGGQSGYMYAKYLGGEGTTSYTAYINTRNRGLNLRKAPGGEVITSYPRGTQVNVLSTDGAWSKVHVNGNPGYMSSKWLSSSKPGTNPGGSVAPSLGTAVVSNPRDTQVLFLRKEPSISSESLGYYRNGTTVQLIEKLDGWYKVRVDGKTGYMMSRFLSVKEQHAGKAVVFNPNGGSFVNFRGGASLSAPIIRTVPVGTSIRVIEKTTDWTKTEIDGKVGYISTWFLKF